MKKLAAVLSAVVLCLSAALVLMTVLCLHLTASIEKKDDTIASMAVGAAPTVGATAVPGTERNAADKPDAASESDAESGTPANLVLDGVTYTPKDYLIAYLREYLQSDEYQEQCAKYKRASGQDAGPFQVTHAFELKLDGYGMENVPLDFLMVRASRDFVGWDGKCYDIYVMAIDYETGEVYDRIGMQTVSPEEGSKEEAIRVMTEEGFIVDRSYDGTKIFSDREKDLPLSKADILEINRAISAE